MWCGPRFEKWRESKPSYSKLCDKSYVVCRRNVLEQQKSDGLDGMGPIKWSLALCVLAVFVLVYFSLWKGVRSTGKVRQVIFYLFLWKETKCEYALSGQDWLLQPDFTPLNQNIVLKTLGNQTLEGKKVIFLDIWKKILDLPPSPTRWWVRRRSRFTLVFFNTLTIQWLHVVYHVCQLPPLIRAERLT